MSSPYEMSDDLPVYVISVAAQLSGMHPQTLRAYDRRLSQEEGVNLSGIKLILDQHRELDQARRLIAELHAEIGQLRVELESTRAVAARLAELRRSGSDTRSGLVPVRSARVAVWEPMTGPAGQTGQPRGDK